MPGQNFASKEWYFVFKKDKRGHIHAYKGYSWLLRGVKIKKACIC